MNEVAELQGESLPENTVEGELELEESPTSEDAEQPEADEERPKPKGVQKRIDELTANWRNAERDRDYWRELAVKTQAPKEPEKPQAAQPQGKPALDNFSSYEEYVEALADWKVEQRLGADREQQTRAQQEQVQQEQIRTFQSRADRVRSSHPDFDTVVANPLLPISDAMAEAAYSSEKGPELLYHLGQNPQEAERIYRLSPHQQAMEMGRLEAKLSRPARTQTNAPAPISPVSGSGGSQFVDPDRLSASEWLAWRNQQLSNR
jgi:hypothetical protein